MDKLGKLVIGFLLTGVALVACESQVELKKSGEDLLLWCSVPSGKVVKWKFNDNYVAETALSGAFGIVNSTLERNGLRSNDSGAYECWNDDGESLKNTTVVVISITGENATAEEKTTSVSLTCRVDNFEVQVNSLKWKRGGKMLTNDSDKYRMTFSEEVSALNVTVEDSGDAGLYICVANITAEGLDKTFEHSFSVNRAPEVQPIKKLRSKVEDETAKIECNVTGFPTPKINWYRKLEEQEEFEKVKYDERVNTTSNENNVTDAVLVIRKLKIKSDRGDYMCIAENSLGMVNSTIPLKVKDKLAAVWPFLGICAEVAIFCSIIFIFEKRRSKKLEEEEEVDAVKQDLMSPANGTDDNELRQRNAVKS